MTIIKKHNGHTIELIIDKIKEYTKDYSKYAIYQVSKMINGKKVPLYKECFTDVDIQRIENNSYELEDDEDDFEFDGCDDIDIDDEELEKLLSM